MRGLILSTPPLDVFEQMAFDELLCESPAENFTLRFYDWKGNAATFGYAQAYQKVSREISAVPATRRPTGGGIVFHDTDVTFSCVLPSQDSAKPAGLYRKLHGALAEGLESLGLECRLCAPCGAGAYALSRGPTAARCFQNPVASDLTDSAGTKILGGALRRFSGAALYQGSLRFEGARQKIPEIKLAAVKSLSAEWPLAWETASADGDFLARARKLAAGKYRSAEWIERF